MSKTHKRLLSVAVVLVLILSMVPAGVFNRAHAAEADVAYIGNTYYNSVQDALDEAGDGETVYLCADAREVSLDVYEGTTLDLNGHTLTVTRQATANGEIKGEGLLAAPKNKTIMTGQISALPVWNGSAYTFAAAPDMTRARMYNGQFVFQPEFNSKEINALFAAGTADDAGLHIVVTLTYKLSGKTFTMEYEVTEDTTTVAYGKATPAPMGLIIEEDFTDLTFTVKVVSDTGAVFSAATVSE